MPSLFTRRDVLSLAVLGATLPWSPAARAAGAEAVAAILRSHWAERFAGKPGGLTFLALTPRGEVFATTIEGVTRQSHFRAASTTKTFTAAAIMLLDQRGLLRIDDLITAPMPKGDGPYLPDAPEFAIPYRDQITIRQLLSHRAGLFDTTNDIVPSGLHVPYAGLNYLVWRTKDDPDHSFTKDELIGVIAAAQVSHSPPGTGYHYSDSHYGMLGKIVEQVSGSSLNAFLEEEFLTPLALGQTHFVTEGNESTLPPPAIPGYSQAEGKSFQDDDYNASYDPGSGNMITTPADLARWIKLLIKGETRVSPSQVARMCEVSADSSYGLGIVHKITGSVDLGFGHAGGTSGYLTDMYYNPVTDVGYVLQCSLIDFGDLRGELGWLNTTGAALLQEIAPG